MPKPRTKKTEDVLDVIYDKITSRMCIGEKAITEDVAKKLIGWNEVTDKDKFHIKDLIGNKIWFSNNKKNRPIRRANIDKLMQEHLHGRWKFNGEPLIIGRNGSILNGQHSLISFLFACQEYSNNPEQYPAFDATMEKAIVFGVAEEDTIINTLDTCAPRTLSDVLFRSKLFADQTAKDRKAVARICQFAINTIWDRVGVEGAFSTRMTHTEAMAFLEVHPRLVEFCLDVYHENGDNVLSQLLPLGYFTGLYYLASCSATDPNDYLADRTEASLDFSLEDKARQFMIYLSSEHETTDPIRQAYAKLIEESGGSRQDRMALWIKAWNAWQSKPKVTTKDLELEYLVQDGIRHLKETPCLGGIDLLVAEVL